MGGVVVVRILPWCGPWGGVVWNHMGPPMYSMLSTKLSSGFSSLQGQDQETYLPLQKYYPPYLGTGSQGCRGVNPVFVGWGGWARILAWCEGVRFFLRPV